MLLWILHWYFGQKQLNALMMDLFYTSMPFFTSQDINWCTGVMWDNFNVLLAVWTAFWRHPSLKRIYWWTSNATFLQICSNDETNWGVSKFSFYGELVFNMFLFKVLISLHRLWVVCILWCSVWDLLNDHTHDYCSRSILCDHSSFGLYWSYVT